MQFRNLGVEYIPLHSLGVIDIPRVASGAVPEAHGPIIRCTYQFLSGGAELNIHDCSHVVFQDIQGSVDFPHVKYVDIVIFVS